MILISQVLNILTFIISQKTAQVSLSSFVAWEVWHMRSLSEAFRRRPHLKLLHHGLQPPGGTYSLAILAFFSGQTFFFFFLSAPEQADFFGCSEQL